MIYHPFRSDRDVVNAAQLLLIYELFIVTLTLRGDMIGILFYEQQR